MRDRSLSALWTLIALISFLSSTAQAESPSIPTERAVARVKPSLVRIEVVWTDYANGREVKYEASGSGVIISKKGYVITNHHVAGRATRVVCILSDNEEIEATLVGTDALADISVLLLQPAKPREFPAVEFGDSDTLNVGDSVLAMGSPLALSQSVTLGIVSNTKMIMPRSFRRFDGFTLDGEDVGGMVRWIGHDAAIYPGNSGGPLVNLNGAVVGINEISLGLGGAIPANLARAVADQIIAHGQVRRSWLGLEIQPLLKNADDKEGVVISGTLEDSPAAHAGFRSNDRLIELAGKPVAVRFDEEIPLLNQMVAALPIGQTVNAVVVRDGKKVTLPVTTAEREKARPDTHELKPWGFTARNISFLAARELKLPNQEGVLITSVRPGGPSGDAKPALQPNDILRSVNGLPLKKVDDLIALTASLTNDQRVVVAFDRRREQLLTVVKVGLKELDDPGLEATKAWLPAAIQVITRDLAIQLGTNSLTGVRITQLYNTNLPLRVGDLIVALDGEKIPASQPGDEEVFTSRIRQYRVGATPELTVLRAGQSQKITVELARSPKVEREMKKFQDNDFEFSVRDLSFFDKVEEQLPEDLRGVLVTEIKDGSWAALGDLSIGDVILAVNDRPQTDVVTLEQTMKQVAAQKPRFVVLRVQRGIHTRYLELEPKWSQP